MKFDEIKLKLKKYRFFRFLIKVKKSIFDGFHFILKSIILFILRKLVFIWNRHITTLGFGNEKDSQNVLYAFYDLSVSPKTFDIVIFLVLAEIYRKENNLSSSYILIVPGSDEKKGSSSYSEENKEWRVRNILIPACFLYPENRFMICRSRKQASIIEKKIAINIFPNNYTVALPISKYCFRDIVLIANKGESIPSISASSQALDYVKTWMKTHIPPGKSAVSITLRESTYEVDRNSNLSAWGEFSRKIDSLKYIPILIRDVEASFQPIPLELENIIIFNEATWHFELRLALYELCFLNMFISNGPTVLSWFNENIRYLVFKIITTTSGATTKEYYEKTLNFPPGSQLKSATPFQKFVWEDDNLEVIEREFKIMCDKIEKTK